MVYDLEVHDLRVFRSVAIKWDPRANFIAGPNASGKTSLLETLVLLSMGRSFRNRRAQALIREGCEMGFARARLSGPGGAERAVRCAGRHRELLENGERVSAAAAALGLPLVVLAADGPARLLQGQAHRRAMLRWLTFHVEPDFGANWGRYRRVFAQRNASLMAQDGSTASWDQPLADSSVPVRAALLAVAALWSQALSRAADPLGLALDLEYLPSFDGPLLAALRLGRRQDEARHSSVIGPHRDGLTIRLQSRPLNTDLSGGQMKRVALALLAAQILVLNEAGKAPLALVDDATAALDAQGLKQLESLVRACPGQWFLTAPDLAMGLDYGQRFHVEQGVVAAAGSPRGG